MIRAFSLLALAILLGWPAVPRAQSTLNGPDADIAANGDYGDFYTWPELRAKIDGWKATHPALIHESTLGRTVENRRIPLLKISDNPIQDEDEPEILLLVGVHPREQAPTIAIVRLIDELLDSYGKDERLTTLVNEREIWIVPMLNVDGKVHDMRRGNGKTRGADWRKNRRDNGDKTVGVDLNRNFPMRWGGDRRVDPGWKASTAQTSGNIYEGRAPASEPETRAIMDFIAARPLRVMIDIHSPLHDMRAPTYLIGAEHARYSALLKGMQAAQKQPYPVRIGKPNEEPPPQNRGGNTGVSFPWCYYTTGAYSFNIEMAPRERYAAPAQIEVQYRDNIRGPLLFLIEAASDLPPAQKGNAKIAHVQFKGKPRPGTKVLWSPHIEGPAAYAVLVSESPTVVVTSEYRLLPLQHPFKLQIEATARAGESAPMRLCIWDAERGLSVEKFELTIE